jgi:Ala-tRNA(Pro) deacylase
VDVFERIVAQLREHGAEHRTFEHEPVRTSEEAARVRGTPLGQGAKAMVLEAGDELVLVVLSASRKVDFKKLKAHLGTRRVQMASAERVREATGCEPGGVPPFGSLFGLRVLLDPSLLQYERIDFNAGERTRSVEMRSGDFVAIERPEIVEFAGEQG